MLKISAVIITKNEERNISRCLMSLQSIVDEIVVVDSGSTDETIHICEQYGAKVIFNEWCGYGPQKNIGNNAAANDYILSLDADEELSSRLQDSILKIKNATILYDAYSFNRKNIYCGKPVNYCGWYPDSKIRLWNKHKGHWNRSAVHEVLEINNDVSQKHLKGDIMHYTYFTINEHIQKIQKYSDLWVKQAKLKGKKASFFKLFISYPWRFFYCYVLRFGFLDGKTGLMVCRMTAFETFLKYSKLYKSE